MIYDVAVIGAGVVGSLIAYELSKYNINLAVIDKGYDVAAAGATKANSAIVHAGYDPVPGTLKAHFNLLGSKMMPDLCKKLGVRYKQNGSIVLALSESEHETLLELIERGKENGVSGLSIVSGRQARDLEPAISDKTYSAMLADTGGIVGPYELAAAAADVAALNGATFIFGFEVGAIEKSGDIFILFSGEDEVKARLIINAAGVYSDKISALAGDGSFAITARKGQYMLLDKSAGGLVSRTVFHVPTEKGKGVLVTPTVDGNLLIGPNATAEQDKDDTDTTKDGLDEVTSQALALVPSLPLKAVITSFAGLRSTSNLHDFIVGASAKVPGLINAAGIESPGLTAAPAIAKYVCDIAASELCARLKSGYIDERAATFCFREASDERRRAAIAQNPAYGRIICRCESVTEGEIIDAIYRPVGARNIDAVKRRTRAGMGRCQGGFCGPRVAEILARELDIPLEQVTKFGGNSYILTGRAK